MQRLSSNLARLVSLGIDHINRFHRQQWQTRGQHLGVVLESRVDDQRLRPAKRCQSHALCVRRVELAVDCNSASTYIAFLVHDVEVLGNLPRLGPVMHQCLRGEPSSSAGGLNGA